MTNTNKVIFGGVTLPLEVARTLEAAGVTASDVSDEVWALRAKRYTPAQLLEHCLDGAEPEAEADWRAYVAAVSADAGVA
jgi:hypothetical protein